MAAKKFTFKKEKGGAYDVYDTTIIKLAGKECGTIVGNQLNGYKVHVMVTKNDVFTDDNPNCAWKWITIARKFPKESDARAALNDCFDSIVAKFPLHFLED